MISTLVVDDDYRVAELHAAYVARVEGYQVVGQAHSGAEAFQATGRQRCDLILLDLYLPDEHGLALLRRLWERPPPHPDIIVITAACDVASVRAAIQLGVVYYLVKPFGFPHLAEQLITYRDMRQRLNGLSEVSQDDVDLLFGMPRVQALDRNRHTSETLTAVCDAVRAATPDISAEEVAAVVGISRPTAQRYLALLAKRGMIDVRPRYGSVGRPENRYRARWPGSSKPICSP